MTTSNNEADGELNLMRGSDLTHYTAWVALFTVAPAADGTGGTEVSGTGYARQSATFSAPANATPGRQVQNSSTINYGNAGSAWGTIVAAGIYDASTAGNLKYVGTLDSQLVVSSGNPVAFAVNALTVKKT